MSNSPDLVAHALDLLDPVGPNVDSAKS
jgi:hypothetical protein